MMRLPLPCVALGLLVGACTDFPNEPARTITVQPVGWAALAVTDVETLAVNVPSVSGSAPITGLRAEWRSSNDALLTVVQTQPLDGASREDTLVAQLRAVATANAGGVATVSVIIEGGAAFEPDTISDTIRVTQRWVSVSAGYQHSCGTTIDRKAFCWGTGLIGDGSTAGSPLPVHVGGQLEFSSTTSGDGYTCGLLVDGRAFCWGSNLLGTVGNSLPNDELTPVAVSLGQTFASVSAGRHHVCGTTAGKGFCWGDDSAWQLGDGVLLFGAGVPPFDACNPFSPIPCSRTPRPVRDRNVDTTDLLAIGPGVTHTCAINAAGNAICWGTGTAEIGSDTFAVTGNQQNAPSEIAVQGGLTFRSITAGVSHNCGLTASDSLAFCWGLNSHGQLGTRSPGSSCLTQGEPVACSPRPIAVPDGHTFARISAGEMSTCGIDVDSTVYCWGSNQFGQLGTPDAQDLCDAGTKCSLRPTPLHLLGDPKVISVSVGQRHACAVTSGGAAYCWGDPTGGKLGSASLANQTAPTAPVRVDEPP
jgi:alpha-tubulin suppressor-like RCC1 family protein